MISDAMDQAVSNVDFQAVANKKVFLDATYTKGATDAPYLISSIRQQMLASGCQLMDSRDKADYVVEIRVGAVGTDRRELLFGIPAINVPMPIPVPIPTNIPELPIVKKTEQRAVAKIAIFAYNRHTGRAVWQSGIVPVESVAKGTWVLGAGPFQHGSIYDEANFAGRKLKLPFTHSKKKDDKIGRVKVAQSAFFPEPEAEFAEIAENPGDKPTPEVVQASHIEPVKTLLPKTSHPQSPPPGSLEPLGPSIPPFLQMSSPPGKLP